MMTGSRQIQTKCQNSSNMSTIFKISRFLNNFLYTNLCSLVTSVKEYNPFCEKPNKSNRYWLLQSTEDVIEKADSLFEARHFLDVYELLNRLKYRYNAEVQWRIARVLFRMSDDETFSKQVRKEMIQEAYDIVNISLDLDKQNANVHKWVAIITDTKYGLDGTDKRVRALQKVKDHLLQAVKLNPYDVVLLYMLGKWCYEMSQLTLFQRIIARILYASVPSSNYKEAYQYFMKAEELNPRFYLPNLYMLGKTCLRLKQYYWAQYYLSIAANLPPRDKHEEYCAKKAKRLSKFLASYDVSKTVLFSYMSL